MPHGSGPLAFRHLAHLVSILGCTVTLERPFFLHTQTGRTDSPEEHGPFLGPNPSIQNHRGSEARESYSAAQLEYHLTYTPLAVRKAPQSSWVRAVTTGRDGSLCSVAPPCLKQTNYTVFTTLRTAAMVTSSW